MNIKRFVLICSLSIIAFSITGCDGGDSGESNYIQESEPQTTTTTVKKTSNDDTSSKTTTTKKTTTKDLNYSSKDDEDTEGFFCMGKGDTCTNKTYRATDLYCHSCDPDDNNIEGDQRKSNGIVGDNNYDNNIDEKDWEIEWKGFLDDKFDEYGY